MCVEKIIIHINLKNYIFISLTLLYFMYNYFMMKLPTLFRNFIFLFTFLFIFLFFLDIYAKNNNLRNRYYKEMIEDLKSLEVSGDLDMNQTVTKLKNSLLDNDVDKFLFCAKNAGLFPHSCVLGDQSFDYKKSNLIYDTLYDTHFDNLEYIKPKNLNTRVPKYDFTPKDNFKAWIRENTITSGRKIDKISEIDQYFNPIIEKISDTKKGKKILILADSYGAGNGLVNIEESWPRLLENKLSSFGDFEVYLISQHGAGYRNFDNWMRSGVLDKIKPDILILSFFENDFYFYDLMLKERSNQFAQVIDPSSIKFIDCLNSSNFFDKFFYFFKSLGDMIKFYQCDFRKVNNKNADVNIVVEDVVNTYNNFNKLTDVPIFFFELDHKMSDSGSIIKNKLIKNGFNFFDLELFAADLYNDFCSNRGPLGSKLETVKISNDCTSTAPNPYDYHYNYNYMNQLIDLAINNIVDKIFDNDILPNNLDANFDYDNSKFITEGLPIELRVRFIDDKNAEVDFIRFTVENTLCSSIDREHVRLNFDSKIEKGSVIKVDSLKQSKPFYINISGYDGDIYTYREAILIEPDNSYYFTVDLDNPSLLFASLEGGCAYDDKELIYEDKNIYENSNGKKILLSDQELGKILADFRVKVSLI